ncbi:hypothetical protein GBAR_LOCUS17126 [Geodia barretti]|uniref:Uncharacterized protein n=1 Tax=Geodia barretti TaxID=519541 RepID=A0AA35SJC7_GEOBA|nr:hypothetical protein GBAR_LOCUS17126 [Geodia barretti]
MNPTIACFLISLQFTASLCDQRTGGVCPDFTATFVAGIDQTVDDPNVLISDPEQTFFKEIMGFRDDDIQHAFDDAVKFFYDRYGLDFSLSQPNEQNVHVLGNATLSLFRIVENVHYLLVLNNWIQTGNTRTTCRDIQFGGLLQRSQGRTNPLTDQTSTLTLSPPSLPLSSQPDIQRPMSSGAQLTSHSQPLKSR